MAFLKILVVLLLLNWLYDRWCIRTGKRFFTPKMDSYTQEELYNPHEGWTRDRLETDLIKSVDIYIDEYGVTHYRHRIQKRTHLAIFLGFMSLGKNNCDR
ncbi:hypothetical protein VIN01S_30180 [Vibrio inusitatus NBRC 102082]|uniref:Uncharacterized protein n=1 Tax=Vibrio inusitatus NBRC 102082 TaxID=1219070 RepID=A0A4Y3I168_9VIBR|nr:hypothetical protein VIN01S_30180 [Vibrio inusitatus NBRC 102082]